MGYLGSFEWLLLGPWVVSLTTLNINCGKMSKFTYINTALKPSSQKTSKIRNQKSRGHTKNTQLRTILNQLIFIQTFSASGRGSDALCCCLLQLLWRRSIWQLVSSAAEDCEDGDRTIRGPYICICDAYSIVTSSKAIKSIPSHPLEYVSYLLVSVWCRTEIV